MASKTRTEFQREKDLQQTARLYLHGWTQASIAAKLKVSQRQISYDLRTLRGRWLESSLIDIDTVKARELARIDELERTYWQAWRRSLKAAQETIKASRKTEEVTSIEARTKETERLGDPRYLAGIQWCIEKRCDIFGLDAPKQHEVRDWRKEAHEDGITDVDGLFEELVKAAMDRKSQGGSVGRGAAADGKAGDDAA